jgi:cytochrome c oxidase subunit IV
MASHASHDVRKDLKRYIAVFIALLVGTIITVFAWRWGGDVMTAIGVHPTLTLTIVVALIIAIIKAFLVAGYFMHLVSERKSIYAIMAATVFFFAAMMYLIVWSRDEMPTGTKYWDTALPHGPAPGSGAAAPAAGH